MATAQKPLGDFGQLSVPSRGTPRHSVQRGVCWGHTPVGQSGSAAETRPLPGPGPSEGSCGVNRRYPAPTAHSHALPHHTLRVGSSRLLV